MYLQFDSKDLQDSRILSREWYLPNGAGGYTGTTVQGRHTRRYHGLLVAALEPPVNRHLMLSGVEDFVVDGQGRVFRLSCPVGEAVVRGAGPGSGAGGSGGGMGDAPKGPRVGASVVGVNDPVALAGRLDGASQAELVSFVVRPFPTWTYDCGGMRVEKELFPVTGQNTVCLIYRIVSGSTHTGGGAQMVLRPLVGCRPHDSLLSIGGGDGEGPVHIEHQGGGVIRFGVADGDLGFYLSSLGEFYGSAPVSLANHHGGGILGGGGGRDRQGELSFWTEPAAYGADGDGAMGVHTGEGGDDSGSESLWCPGLLMGPLSSDFAFPVIASTVPTGAMACFPLREAAVELQGKIQAQWPTVQDGIESLVSCYQAPLVKRQANGLSVIHGYPGPTDHGRTAFISSVGLCLIPGELDQFRSIITTMCDATSKGMLPDSFPERGVAADGAPEGEPTYVHADTGLWLFYAVFKYLQFTEDFDFVKNSVYWTLVEVLGHYQRGTRGIRMDRGDGLLVCEDTGYPMTWMDGVTPDGKPVTPRLGKAVEVNALWYNALAIMEWVSSKLGRSDLMRTYRGLANRVRESFTRTFWNPRNRCLYDCVSYDGADASIRPNQILAVSLPHRLLTGDRELDVLSVVERELLTPYGLRSLSPRDPAYVGRCLPSHGGASRVSSGEAAALAARVNQVKHQGAVWPWLLGPFVDAQARLHGAEAGFNERAASWFKALLEYQAGVGMGGIAEFFDGDAPHTPRGVPCATLSYGEVLRAYVEQIQEYPSFNIRAAR